MKRDLPEPVFIAGIDEPLPPGEQLLWQGAPRWQALALRALHVRKLAIYFGVLLAWRVIAALADGATATAAIGGALWLVVLAGAAIGLLVGIAHAMQRTTIYAITDKRVVMRVGIALPMTLNLPLRQVEAAVLKMQGDGSGDIALALDARDRIAWLHLWPHARPWHLARPQPMLRGLPEPLRVADILTRAVGIETPAAVRAAPAPAAHVRALTARAA